MFAHSCAEALQHGHGVVIWAAASGNEFFPTPANNQITLAHTRPQYICESTQYVVTCGMPVRIVDMLKKVDIDNHYDAAISEFCGYRLATVVIKEAAINEAR